MSILDDLDGYVVRVSDSFERDRDSYVATSNAVPHDNNLPHNLFDGTTAAWWQPAAWEYGDDFPDADSALTMGNSDPVRGIHAPAWTPLSGTWGISSNRAYNVDNGSQRVTVLETGLADCTVSVTIQTVGSDCGIAYRAVDDNNYWIYTNLGAVYKRVAGTFTQVATLAGYTTGQRVAVRVSGNVHEFFVNGVSQGTVTDAALNTATKHGLRTSTSTATRFDTFRVFLNEWTLTVDRGDGAQPLISSVHQEFYPSVDYIAVDFHIDSSPNGVTWTTRATVTGNASTSLTTSITATTDRWLRVVVTKINNNTGVLLDTYGHQNIDSYGHLAILKWTWDSIEQDEFATPLGTTDSEWGGVDATWVYSPYATWSAPFGIEDGRAVTLNVGATYYPSVDYYAWVESGVADGIVQVTFDNTYGDPGMIWRLTDNINFYVYNATNTFKNVAGVYTVVGQTFSASALGRNLNTGDVTRVVMSGSTHSLYVQPNGTGPFILASTWTDAFNATATKHGLRGNLATGSAYDDFIVAELAAAPPTIDTDDLLDGTVAVRQEGVRWDLHDRDDNYLGQLMIDRDSAPQISNDVDRAVRRTVGGMSIPARPLVDNDTSHYYADDLNVLTMRVRPHWLLQNGEEFPLGWFRWGDDSAHIYSWGEPRDASLVDFCSVLDQPLDVNLGFGSGTNVGTALTTVAQAAGFTALAIDGTSATLTAPIAWVAGRDTRLKAMESLCALAGYLPPYFDNDGVLTCRAVSNLSTAEADFYYGFAVGGVVDGSIVSSNDQLTAPNRYVAIDSSAQDAPRVGTFDVPDDAPHSFANTGVRITRTVDLQGMDDTSTVNLDAVAEAAYASDTSSYHWLGFSSGPNPRHDTFDVVDFDGGKYREQSWTLECRAGGQMSHDLRGAY